MKKKNLIWAIDPFEDEDYVRPVQFQEFIPWLDSIGLKVVPTHVVAMSPREISEDDRVTREEILRAVRREMLSYLRILKMPEDLDPELLVESSGARKVIVERLIQFASEKDALAILSSTHGRRGLERLVLGSFTENLIQNAPCPVVILGHSVERPPLKAPIDRILFCTDFSKNCLLSFDAFLDEVERLKVPVTLFHALTLPGVSVSEFGIASNIPENFFAAQEEWAEKEGKRWIERAKHRGVEVDLEISELALGAQVSELILESAEKNQAGLIVMASVTHGATALIAGSVAREVFRANQYPVWIYGPSALERLQLKTSNRLFRRKQNSRKAQEGHSEAFRT